MSGKEKAVVEINAGKIKGSYQQRLYLFKGIPYAAPPVGERRWLPPEPVKPWGGVYHAQSFGKAAPQNNLGPPVAQDFKMNDPQSEDCLYLNIWSPGLDDSRRPVLVWIHGGAFIMGSGSQEIYDGSTLAQRGNVVIVTINYRLGTLGFLCLNEITGGRIPATGNEGLLDQIAALAWVRDNIAVFGGDPDNVTLFGESAGAMSIGCLLAMPKARGLFHKAILQSGASSTAISSDEATLVVEQILDILGLSGKNADELRTLAIEQLLSAELELMAKIANQGGKPGLTLTLPVIDGKTLPEMPIESIKHGSAGNVTLLVGSNLEEWNLMGMMDPDLPKLDEVRLVKRCQLYIPGQHISGLIETYRNTRAELGMASPAELLKEIMTDLVFRIPAIRLVEAQQHYLPSYNYLFIWKSPIMNGILGACHVLEVGFVFGTYNSSFCGSGSAADRLSRNIQDAWLAFARTGDPSTESIGSWPPYGERRITMLLGEECRIEEAPYEEKRCSWDSIPSEFTGRIETG
jgi:para-nitrobenzyl esterase